MSTCLYARVLFFHSSKISILAVFHSTIRHTSGDIQYIVYVFGPMMLLLLLFVMLFSVHCISIHFRRSRLQCEFTYIEDSMQNALHTHTHTLVNRNANNQNDKAAATAVRNTHCTACDTTPNPTEPNEFAPSACVL